MEETKVDERYKEAFNHSYEVAKELKLSLESFQNVDTKDIRMQGIQDGLKQYNQDFIHEKEKQKTPSKGIIPPFDMDKIPSTHIDLTPDKKDKSKDVDKGL